MARLSPVMHAAQSTQPEATWAVNNRVKNILCVGSIDDSKQLSSFTNILITQVPYVLSYGETILSTVQRTSCDGSTERLTEKLGDFPRRTPILTINPLMEVMKGEYDAILKEGGLFYAHPDISLASSRQYAAMQLIGVVDNVMTGSYGAAKQAACMNSRQPYARMSGTSMATPTVAGIIARYLAEDLSRQGKLQEQIYLDPAYSPESIVQMLRSRSQAFGGTSILKDVTAVTDARRWSEADRARGHSKIIGVISPSAVLGTSNVAGVR
ncbi:MAG: hypothetical protein EOP39_19110 [Rubrivivax sp.]|nr:MAG: hypothetical protein EOP39_19110 [Rubrivivax sp.]